MIAEEIAAFEHDWSAVLQRARNLSINIGTKDEMAASSKQLAELQDISNQATESTDALSMEIQSLRIALNETFSMVTEARAKRAMYGNLEWVFLIYNCPCQTILNFFLFTVLNQCQHIARHINDEPDQPTSIGEAAATVGHQRSTIPSGEQTDRRLLVVSPAECEAENKVNL